MKILQHTSEWSCLYRYLCSLLACHPFSAFLFTVMNIYSSLRYTELAILSIQRFSSFLFTLSSSLSSSPPPPPPDAPPPCLAFLQVPPQIVLQISLALVGEDEGQLETLVTEVHQDLHANTKTGAIGPETVGLFPDLPPPLKVYPSNLFFLIPLSEDKASEGLGMRLPRYNSHKIS